MYWSDVKDGTIRKAGMDGTNHDVVAMNGIVWPNAMALDLPAGRLYWLDASTDQAFSIKLDGTEQKVNVMRALSRGVVRISVWEGSTFFTSISISIIIIIRI